MRFTLLEMTQEILASLDGEEINSITDTVEAQQVVTIIKGVYYDMATDLGLPEHETLFQLTASGSALRPCLMTTPTTVAKVRNIRYDYKLTGEESNYTLLQYVPFEEFLDRQQGLREIEDDVDSQTVTVNSQTYDLMYWTDRMPTFYTTPDDDNYFFDAIDTDEDSTLQASKTMCMGTVYPTFTESDAFAPDLNPHQFSYFRNRCKVRAFQELKQQANPEAIGEARRQKIILQKRKLKSPGQAEVKSVPRYGRK